MEEVEGKKGKEIESRLKKEQVLKKKIGNIDLVLISLCIFVIMVFPDQHSSYFIPPDIDQCTQ